MAMYFLDFSAMDDRPIGSWLANEGRHASPNEHFDGEPAKTAFDACIDRHYTPQ